MKAVRYHYIIGHPGYSGINAQRIHISQDGATNDLIRRGVDPKLARDAMDKARQGFFVTVNSSKGGVVEVIARPR